MNKLFAALVQKRGWGEDFLKPKYEDCVDPYELSGMDVAVKRILRAAEQGEKVLIYGDYDVDGVTASTVMYETLKMAGVREIEVMLPNRFTDGYGMNKKVIQRAKEFGAKLVVTVDCGSANVSEVAALNAEGVDVIVTDHHECPEKLPEAVAVINPKKERKETPLRDLAGVGVAFKVAQALVKTGAIKEGREKWLLDLVVIGTLCDNMAMTIENRRLCYYGMIVLRKTRREGLKALIAQAKTKKLNTDAVAFQIGPRLNAAGRMETAELSLSLLMTESQTEAIRLAKRLEELNERRRLEQQKGVDEIAATDAAKQGVIVACGRWHEGILGIIAGRLAEDYCKPAFVFTEVEGVFKGSGRTYGEFNLAQALCECQNCVLAGGGHAGACGVRVTKEKIGEFERKINEYYDSLGLKTEGGEIKAEVETENVGEFDAELLDELAEIEPFGEGDKEPVFEIRRATLMGVKKMGKDGQHLSLLAKGADGAMLRLVAFNALAEWMEMREGDCADVWLTVRENVWKGEREVEGIIMKMALAN